METLQELYNKFLGFFPVFMQPGISIVLAVFLVYSAFQVIKRNFVYLILLVILLPAAIPILKSIFNNLMSVIRYLIS